MCSPIRRRPLESGTTNSSVGPLATARSASRRVMAPPAPDPRTDEGSTSPSAKMRRTTGDITANFDRISLIGREQAGLARYAGAGHWNDPDMLEVGNGKLTLDENRTHMGMWAMLAAPLLAGNNLSQLSPDINAILTNREIIAIDQDPLGREADRIYAEGPIEIWARPLADGSRALAIFNFGEQRSYLRGISLHLAEAGAANGWHARDVWMAHELGPIYDSTQLTLPRHGCIILRLSK